MIVKEHGIVTNLGRGEVDNLLCGHVVLVADEQLVHVLRGVAVNLLQPLLDVLEGLLQL